jgi:hypothetical protein
MSNILAAVTGNYTNPNTWIGGVVPGAGDVAVANGKVITINESVTCAEVRNDATGGATAGGYFSLSAGVTLAATVYAGGTAVGLGCVQASTTGPSWIIGDVYAGTGCIGARNGGAQIFTIIGTVYGNGYGPGSSGITAGIHAAVNASTGTLYVKATVQGARGMPAVSGPFQFIDAAHASAKVRATAGLTEITLRAVDAVVPYTGDVKLGVTYAGKVGTATRSACLDMSGHFSGTETEMAADLVLADDGATELLTDDSESLEF